jgi:hypothetical protein
MINCSTEATSTFLTPHKVEMKLLEVLFQLFHLPVPPATTIFSEAVHGRVPTLKSPHGDIIDMYNAALLAGFMQWGLISALEEVCGPLIESINTSRMSSKN